MELELTIVQDDPRGEDGRELIRRLDEELSARYDDPEIGDVNREELSRPGTVFFVARLGGRPVGCGAVRPCEPGIGEVKRMFVAQEARRSGIARRILQEIERQASLLGYKSIRLETGAPQHEAIGLYESAGYVRIPGYGRYASHPLTRCFEKSLDEAAVNL